MTARNDITGDLITSKSNTEAYRNNFDAIFGKNRLQTQFDDGPEFEDGPDSEGFKGPRPYNGFAENAIPYNESVYG
jgi:hypothetical protein